MFLKQHVYEIGILITYAALLFPSCESSINYTNQAEINFIVQTLEIQNIKFLFCIF